MDARHRSTTLPSIRSLFPELLSTPQTSYPLRSVPRQLQTPQLGSQIAVKSGTSSLSQRASLSSGSSGQLTPSSRREGLSPRNLSLDSPSTLYRLPVPSAVDVRADHEENQAWSPRSGYSLDIMRLHPLTADLEHVASSSSVSSPPRAPFRSGLVPYGHEDGMDVDIDVTDMLTACSQPVFRVSVQSLQEDSSRGGPRDEEEDKTRRHRCPQCGKGFNRPSSLVTHVNMHTGTKPYPCLFDGCPRRFNVKSNMRRHYQRHLRPHPIHIRELSPTPSASASSNSRSPTPLSRKLPPTVDAEHTPRPPVAFGGRS
ncbi:hypothetical protein C8Q77DRAFT_369778 [Trametes polyzona]|nr:hypothetical protein C8Q77DRAFT_369778 [Trametes polyzona]